MVPLRFRCRPGQGRQHGHTAKSFKLDTTADNIVQYLLRMALRMVCIDVTVSVTGTDAGSGVGSQVVSLDGSTWVSSLTLSADGVYTVHVVSLIMPAMSPMPLNISVDHTAPVPDMSLSPASPRFERLVHIGCNSHCGFIRCNLRLASQVSL